MHASTRLARGALLFTLVLVAPTRAADDVFTDEKKAGIDFILQGEYEGMIEKENELKPFGAHVLAIGGGKFKVYLLKGGLPGKGWDKNERPAFDGVVKDGLGHIRFDDLTGTIKNGVIIVEDKSANKIGQLLRVLRNSPTLAKRPPRSATVLFDSVDEETLANWTNDKGDDPPMTTEDGELIAGANSKHKFQDCFLHLEFRTPFMPKATGQGRGNSGVYLQGRYEVQVLDSFALEGKDNECGGVYSIKAPDVNMCYPPLAWQTYDITYKAAKFDELGMKTANARITVEHNGVVIHKDVELPKATTAAPLAEGPEPGFLHLQAHGAPVIYRNIWMIETKPKAAAPAKPEAKTEKKEDKPEINKDE
jgi:hypothetical protein